MSCVFSFLVCYYLSQRRCAEYLPQSDAVGDSIAVHGDYEIFMKRQIHGDNYIFSCLSLKNMEVG